MGRSVVVMTLGNMRENGVRSLAVTCGALWCHHEAVLDVTAFANDVVVPSFGPRLVCTVCGAIGADARPNWNEASVTIKWRFPILDLYGLAFARSQSDYSAEFSVRVPSGWHIMKLVAEYLADAIKFERMAEDTTDPKVKAAFKSQADAYRNLAIRRAKELGMPVPDTPQPTRD